MNNRKFYCFLFLLVLFSFIFVPQIKARLGVGVGTGQIVVDQKLKSGIIYQFPSVSVINTGDEESDYTLDVAYHQNQPELMPNADWFTFKPSQFHLGPNAIQSVDITLSLPLKTKPGNYFAYLEAHPVKKSENGITSVSIAAASKLYFTVLPSNIFEGIYYRIISFWTRYLPWTNIVGAIVATIIIILLFKRFFNLNIQIKKKSQDE